ncbi:MAG TPA: DinB family protein [Dermatophilaceae bacterium]|nr:DinB family protein [Dermatophilaceae bacterium]
MDVGELLVDGFGRVRDGVHAVLDGLGEEQLAWRPAPGANSIGWLVWHLTRVQDDHVAHVAGRQQAYTEGGWHQRLGLPFPAPDIGFGHSSEDVAGVSGVAGGELAAYLGMVHERTVTFVRGLAPADLDRVVDTCWDPPVTLGVRLVSVLEDDLQHLGQAAYVRGLLRPGAGGAAATVDPVTPTPPPLP